MEVSDAHLNVPTDNPLAQEEFDVAMLRAQQFWRHHGLRDIVDEDEFVKGALIFHDLEVARVFEYDSGKHTEEDKLRYDEHQRRLSGLCDRQKRSLRWYACRTEYRVGHDADALVKQFIFAVGDAVVGVLVGKPKGPEDKLLWDHVKTFSRAQWQIFCTCCLAAMTQGWDQSAMNGANIAWPTQLNVNIDTNFGINMFGWLNAAPFFIGAIVGSLLTDPLINAGLGRRWAIALGGWFSLIPVICTLFVTNWAGFMCCRIALGVGMGAKASVVPIYISEIAPEAIRGRMSMCWQLFDTSGILTGSVVNYIIYCYTQGKPSWKIMISISGVPALLFLTLILFCVESPRWLIKKNRYKEALTALIALHQLPSPVIACGELYMIFRRLEAEESKYLDELKRYNNSNDTRSTSEDTLSTELQPRIIASAVEGQEGRARRSYVQSQGDGATDTQIASSGSIVQPRHENSPRHLPTEAVQSTESSEATTLSEEGSHSSGYVPLELKDDINLLTRIKLLWRVSHIRRALRASQFVMAAQQACGINILAFMSNIMFANAMTENATLPNLPNLSSSDTQRSLQFSVYFGIVNCFSTFIPLFFIDGSGRRALLKATFPLMAISLLVSGGGLLLRARDPEAGRDLFYAFTIIFTFFFSIGEGPAAFVISSEVFPLMVRELGMSLAVFTNFFLASVLSFCIPQGLTRAANTGGFWMAFGGLNVVLWILSLLFVYETSGESLEGISTKYNKSWKQGSWLGKRISELRAKIRKKQ